MPELNADELRSWDIKKIDAAMQERLNEVNGIKERNGGTLVGAKGEDADKVSQFMRETNMLGEARDVLVEQNAADEKSIKLDEFLNSPTGGVPGFPNGKAQQAARDIGAQFLDSKAWKAFKERGVKDEMVSLPVSSLWQGYQGIGENPSLEAALFQSSAYPSQPQFIPGPIPTLYAPNNIGPLMAQGTTNSAVIRYVLETVTAAGAAAVAEGATKPEANISFSSVDEAVRKIAVLLPLTDEALEDEPFLRSYLNARLGLFVRNEEDRQLLLGTGTAPEIRGIMNRSGINTATSYSIGGTNPDQLLLEAVFHAAMRVRDGFLEPDAVVMKPSTWEIARLAKDGNRNYILGPPADDAPFRLWGLRVVLNANMPAQVATNKVALVGAFATAAMVVRRSGIDLAVSDSHSTFFAENKVMLRAEERLALAVWRPAGFATVTSAA